MDKIEHTPGPWFIQRYPGGLTQEQFVISHDDRGGDNNTEPVASVWNNDNQPKQFANAQHICLCVNNHDDLLAACRDALQDYEALNDAAKICGIHPFTISPGQLREAIAKAEASPE